jgi:hypothetical protein
MLRHTVAAVALVALSAPACAEAWMVKSSTLGCRDRETRAAIDAAGSPPARDSAPPAGCVVLDAGERLLDQPEVGRGFDDYVKLQRRDSSLVYVRAADVVRDPGIGSVSEDRIGE